MRLADFEQQVWEVENIRIVVRGHENGEVEDYDLKYAAMENWRTREFLTKRIEPRVGERKVMVIQGDGETPHGSVLLRTLRKTYSPK